MLLQSTRANDVGGVFFRVLARAKTTPNEASPVSASVRILRCMLRERQLAARMREEVESTDELPVGAFYQFGQAWQATLPLFHFASTLSQLYWLITGGYSYNHYRDLAEHVERACALFEEFVSAALSATNGGYGVYGVEEEDELLDALFYRVQDRFG